MKHHRFDLDEAEAVASACLGKVGFVSPALAYRARRERTALIAIYRCPHCGLWHHTGSKDHRAASRRARRRVSQWLAGIVRQFQADLEGKKP